MTQRDFDVISQNIAESIDDIVSTAPRARDRRIALIQRQVLHAMRVAYKAARSKALGLLAAQESSP